MRCDARWQCETQICLCVCVCYFMCYMVVLKMVVQVPGGANDKYNYCNLFTVYGCFVFSFSQLRLSTQTWVTFVPLCTFLIPKCFFFLFAAFEKIASINDNILVMFCGCCCCSCCRCWRECFHVVDLYLESGNFFAIHFLNR